MVEAEPMQNSITTALAPVPVWMVQLQVELAGSGTRSPGDGDLEPMVELMYRTEGVRSVAVVPLQSGLAVAVGLDAAGGTDALERARGLTVSCARYAGLGEATVVRARVTAATDVAVA
jgi:hypothetical protein